MKYLGTLFLVHTLSLAPSIAQPLMQTVMNTSDAGPGSLRQAILDAGPGDEVVFDAG